MCACATCGATASGRSAAKKTTLQLLLEGDEEDYDGDASELNLRMSQVASLSVDCSVHQSACLAVALSTTQSTCHSVRLRLLDVFLAVPNA